MTPLGIICAAVFCARTVTFTPEPGGPGGPGGPGQAGLALRPLGADGTSEPSRAPPTARTARAADDSLSGVDPERARQLTRPRLADARLHGIRCALADGRRSEQRNDERCEGKSDGDTLLHMLLPVRR